MRLKIFVSILCIGVAIAGCTPNNVQTDPSLGKYFKEAGVTGCFGLLDNGQGSFQIYNLPRYKDSAYTPASTFKIVNSLIGIETGVVRDDSSVIKWDSVRRGRSECDTDLAMIDAFRVSCPAWYQELARRIGKEKMQHYLDTLGYASRFGHFRIKDNLDSFWLDNSARITADEQLGLMKKLYFDQLPFQKRTQALVRDMMLMEDNANYRLGYKTGWGTTPEGHALGWMLGWIEENKHLYFYVLEIENPDRNFNLGPLRLQILKSILKQYGFMEGKK